MRFDHARDLAHFIKELKGETERGLPLVGTALIDEKLLESLQAFFIAGKSSKKLLTEGNSVLGTFSARIEACFALGLIDEFEYQEIGLLRKIRNEFAHSKHGTSFKTEKIKRYCLGLKSDLPDLPEATNDARYKVMNSIVCIILRLYYRPEWVEEERRKPKVWVTPDQTRWRKITDEKPPEDIPVLAIDDGNPILAIRKNKKKIKRHKKLT